MKRKNGTLHFCSFIFVIFFALMLSCVSTTSAEEKKAHKIILISDLNDAYGSMAYSPQIKNAVNFIIREKPDLVLCAGDMVAGQSRKIATETFPIMWNAFNSEILSKFKEQKIPFAFSFGNHDGAGPSFTHERKAAVDFWQKNIPELNYVDSTGLPEFYSFNLDGIFFAVIDASSANLKQNQTEWLEQQLSSSAARKATIRIVMGHLPLHAVSEGRNKAGDVISKAENFFKLLEINGADYYISGHHHAFYPSKKGKVKFISAGCLGGGPRRLVGSTQKPLKTLTILAFSTENMDLSLKTFDMSSEPREISISDLPLKIDGFNGTSYRYP